MANANAEYCVVHITAPSPEEAKRIATALVEEHLAACCSIIPGMRSVYRWQEEIHDDTEQLLLCKTRTDHFARLAERVREMHSYDVPEIIQLPITRGSQPYLNWIDETVSGRS